MPAKCSARVAVRLLGNTATLWVNGAVVGTNANMSLSAADLGSSPNNWIGRSQYPDPPLNGRVDEFRVYKGALTDSQIVALAMSGPSVVDAGPAEAGNDADAPGVVGDASDGGSD